MEVAATLRASPVDAFFSVALPLAKPGIPMLVLETALPIKFAATLVEALGREPDRPPKFEGIEALPKRVHVMPADAEQVKAYIAAHCPG